MRSDSNLLASGGMKGLSPMIAVVLLVAFTVGIGGILSLWLTGLTTSQTQTVSNSSNAQIKCSPSLVIAHVKVPPITANGSFLNVTVENRASVNVLSVTIEAVNSTTVVTNTAIGNLGPGATGFIGFSGATGGGSILLSVRARGTCEGSAVSASCDPTQTCWELAGS